MGDMADYMIEQNNDMLADHEGGHRHFPPEDCPWCAREDTKPKTAEGTKMTKYTVTYGRKVWGGGPDSGTSHTFDITIEDETIAGVEDALANAVHNAFNEAQSLVNTQIERLPQAAPPTKQPAQRQQSSKIPDTNQGSLGGDLNFNPHTTRHPFNKQHDKGYGPNWINLTDGFLDWLRKKSDKPQDIERIDATIQAKKGGGDDCPF